MDRKPTHVYEDYTESIDYSADAKALMDNESYGDACIALFLDFYIHGVYGSGDINEARYSLKNTTISISNKSGKLYVSLEG